MIGGDHEERMHIPLAQCVDQAPELRVHVANLAIVAGHVHVGVPFTSEGLIAGNATAAALILEQRQHRGRAFAGFGRERITVRGRRRIGSVGILEMDPAEEAFPVMPGEPPESGRLDLREYCYMTAVVDDRPSLTSFRFKENCLIRECWRSVSWVEARGGYVVTTPCRVTATGSVPVFTVPDDVRGQVAVTLDVAGRRASWTSTGTGQRGVIDFAVDCDVSRQVRREQPA